MEKVSAASAMEWSIKLEKALRSKSQGRAVEAILETGRRLEQWSREPEPATAVYYLFSLVAEEDRLFANTILLRLADAFCAGDKLVRVAVVQVFMSIFKQNWRKKRSEWGRGFLSEARVQNRLELLKRVKDVYDNGDTEVRAFALVLFGCWRDFASDCAPIRHLIFISMVSSHDLEVRSSLFAAACFCEVADDFAQVVLGMLIDMVKFPELMPKTRLAAVRVFAKMGCSHTIANKAFKICLKLMLDSSEEDVLVAFLVSLSKLASRSTHLATELAEVIMPFLDEEKTSHMQAVAVKCLHFLVKRGMCCSLVNASVIELLSSLLNKAALSVETQCEALQILRKVLVYKLCSADASEYSHLITIVQNASNFPIMSSSYLAISTLAYLLKEIVPTAEKRQIGVSSRSLLLQIVVSIIDRVTQLGRLCSDPFEADCAVVGEVQNLLNLLLLLGGEQSEMGPLVLDKISLFLEYVLNQIGSLLKTERAPTLVFGIFNYKGKRGTVVMSKLLAYIHKFLVTFLENLEVVGAISSQVYEKVKHVTELVRSCSFLDWYTQVIYSLLSHSPIVWGCLWNEMRTNSYVDGNSGISLITDVCHYGIFSLECLKQIIMEGDYWPAYRAGINAASLGAWVASAFIFDQLSAKVQSDSCSFWLRSLSYFAYAEGKIQLLLQPVGNSDLVNWLGSNGFLPEFSQGTSAKCGHNVVLHEAYKNLCSSLEALDSNVALSEVFCFQMWFLTLKTQILGTVLDLVKLLDSFDQDISNKEVETRLSIDFNYLQRFGQLSVRFQRLAKELDILATSFIDIDHGSSRIIAALALSCSVLAFAAGFVLFIPGLPVHEALGPFTSQSGLCLRLVQDLIGRLWQVDPEISKNLSLLVKVDEPLKKCFHRQPWIQTLRVCGKAKEVISMLRDALSGISDSQNKVNMMHDEVIVSEITRDWRHLLSETVMKWVQIPFGVPRYFFKTRPCVGTKLFALNRDTKNPGKISVAQGFHLSLDLCLQLKNVQPQLPLRITKLYCLLYARLAFYNHEQRMENRQGQCYSMPWKNEDLMEMSDKLFQHATEPRKCKTSRQSHWDKSNGVFAFVQLELNDRGQGFCSCLLDVSRFPVGSYQIKWQSCCIDSQGDYWNLLSLNAGPLFTVHKSSVG